MTMLREISNDTFNGVAVTRTLEGLDALSRPDCAAAIWQRQLLPTFQDWLDALPPKQLPSTRLGLRPGSVHDAVTDVCRSAGLPLEAECIRLIDDIAALANTFANQNHAPYIRLRLEPISTNACRKFHIDALTTRLVCTYRGTGTQYGISKDGTEPKQIFTVPTGAPIVLRGTLKPEHPRTGLLHRSPPIEGTGETRLVLVLDPVFDDAEVHPSEMI